MSEPMPKHDEQRYTQWAYKRRESLASKSSRVRAALDHTPKTSTAIGKEIGMPACVVGGILSRLKQAGHARSVGKAIAVNGHAVLTWVADSPKSAPTVADLVSRHAGSLACRRWA